MSPLRLLLYAILIAGTLGVIWVTAGSRIVAVLDRLTTAPDGTEPAPDWFAIDDGEGASFTLGNRRWPIAPTWRISEAPAGHVTLGMPQGSIVLGVLLHSWSTDRDHRNFDFRPDSGDEVSITRRRSRLAWPRPFAFSLLGGRDASAGRYMYHRLKWRKKNGTVLEIVWRDEQRYRSSDGWADLFIRTLPRVTLRT
jgi:hypothetical protein